MGLFTRKQRSTEPSVVELRADDYCEVVGESFYAQAIAQTLPTCWSDEEDDRVFRAILIAEPDNEYDSNAVGVWSSVGKVGHLPREEAALYRPLFDEIRRRGYDGGCCEAVMKGGTPDKPNIGIWLRLSRPEYCLAGLD